MNEHDPNFIAAELADDVRAAARSLAASYEAALEHRLGWRVLGPLKAAVRRSCQAAAALDLAPPPAPPEPSAFCILAVEDPNRKEISMASLGMNGPYKLDNATIDAKVTKTSPGNYALGKEDDEGIFHVGYVGRSDSDVNARLKRWVGKTKRPLFKYSYATSAKAAFEKECQNYHGFEPPGNDVHPARPDDSGWECPRCDIFD